VIGVNSKMTQVNSVIRNWAVDRISKYNLCKQDYIFIKPQIRGMAWIWIFGARVGWEGAGGRDPWGRCWSWIWGEPGCVGGGGGGCLRLGDGGGVVLFGGKGLGWRCCVGGSYLGGWS